jgi:hypothetical protein
MTSLQIIILLGAILQFVFELFLKIKNERHMSSMRSEMPKGVNAITPLKKANSPEPRSFWGSRCFRFFFSFFFHGPFRLGRHP